MDKNQKIMNQCISSLLLVIYLFSIFSILSYHNHNEDDYHDHHDLPVCENLDGNSFNNSDCCHKSHITSYKESCAICDFFTNCNPGILDISINTDVELVTVKEIQLFTSHYIIDAKNTQNKSPPFII